MLGRLVVHCLPSSCFHKSSTCAKRGTRLQHCSDLSEWRLRRPLVWKLVELLVLLDSSTPQRDLREKNYARVFSFAISFSCCQVSETQECHELQEAESWRLCFLAVLRLPLTSYEPESLSFWTRNAGSLMLTETTLGLKLVTDGNDCTSNSKKLIGIPR